MFSGDIVSADHLKNQYGLVIGTEGVQRIRRLVELDRDNRDNNKAIAAAESEITTVIRTIGPPAMTLDSFLALLSRIDIQEAITAQDQKVQRVQRAKELKAAAEPSLFPLPAEPGILRELLNKSIEGIAEDALAKVRAHIATHESISRQADMPHESWLESGTVFVQTDNCPFCGQHLTDRTMVNAYKNLFSKEYTTLASSIKKTRDTFDQFKTGEVRANILRLSQQNNAHFKYWMEAGKLDSPDISNIETAISTLEDAANALDALFATKQGNLTQAITGPQAESALQKWEDGRKRLSAANAAIDTFLRNVATLKNSINLADLPHLENELKVLQATKRR